LITLHKVGCEICSTLHASFLVIPSPCIRSQAE